MCITIAIHFKKVVVYAISLKTSHTHKVYSIFFGPHKVDPTNVLKNIECVICIDPYRIFRICIIFSFILGMRWIDKGGLYEEGFNYHAGAWTCGG